MADLKPVSKKTLQNVFAEVGERKLVLIGPGAGPTSKLQDSRFGVAEAGLDHVVIKLLGDDTLVLPYSAITSLKLERQQLTIQYR